MMSEKFESWSQVVFLGRLSRENCGGIEGQMIEGGLN